MKRLIFGIAGPAGSGKDTLADLILNEVRFLYATHAAKVSFASPMKAALAAMGFPEPDNREDKEKPVPGFAFTWREAAQTLGTEWGRGLDPELWVKLALRNAKYEETDLQGNHSRCIVFSDVRFNNEAQAITEAGGIIIKLTGRYADLHYNANHASEKPIMDAYVTHHINNRGSMAFLETMARAIASDWAKQVRAQVLDPSELPEVETEAVTPLAEPMSEVDVKKWHPEGEAQ